MKTIEVPDDIYDKLLEMSNEIKNQDCRCTAKPYFYQIRQKERIYGIEDDFYVDGYVWINGDKEGDVDSDRDSMIECLEGNDVSFDKESVDDDGLNELMEENGYHKVNYMLIEKYENSFLTEKSCKEHIRMNHYHYESPVDYLNHAYRNPDMELIFRFLETLGK